MQPTASAPERPSPWPEGLVAAYQEHWLALTRLGYLLTGDRGTAEEVVQDAFVRTLAAWPRVESPLPYLRTCVVNGVRDRGRRIAVAQRRADRTVDHTVDHPDELWDALAVLDPRRRTVIVLRFYADLPDREIAEIVGCRPSTVRTLAHRGLRDLRRELTA